MAETPVSKAIMDILLAHPQLTWSQLYTLFLKAHPEVDVRTFCDSLRTLEGLSRVVDIKISKASLNHGECTILHRLGSGKQSQDDLLRFISLEFIEGRVAFWSSMERLELLGKIEKFEKNGQVWYRLKE